MLIAHYVTERKHQEEEGQAPKKEDREIITFLEQGNKNDLKLAALKLMLEFGSVADKRKVMKKVSNLSFRHFRLKREQY